MKCLCKCLAVVREILAHVSDEGLHLPLAGSSVQEPHDLARIKLQKILDQIVVADIVTEAFIADQVCTCVVLGSLEGVEEAIQDRWAGFARTVADMPPFH